jgi:DNA repair ATPase RecN
MTNLNEALETEGNPAALLRAHIYAWVKEEYVSEALAALSQIEARLGELERLVTLYRAEDVQGQLATMVEMYDDAKAQLQQAEARLGEAETALREALADYDHRVKPLVAAMPAAVREGYLNAMPWVVTARALASSNTDTKEA